MKLKIELIMQNTLRTLNLFENAHVIKNAR